MSEYEIIKGKLTKVVSGIDINEIGKYISEHEKETGDFYIEDDSYFNCEGYHFHDGVLYKNEMEKEEGCNDIFEGHKNNDGSINYLAKYYNGGMHSSDAITEVLNNLK